MLPLQEFLHFNKISSLLSHSPAKAHDNSSPIDARVTKTAQAIQQAQLTRHQNHNNGDNDDFSHTHRFSHSAQTSLSRTEALSLLSRNCTDLKYDDDENIVPHEGMFLDVNDPDAKASIYSNRNAGMASHKIYFRGLPKDLDVRYFIRFLTKIGIPLESICNAKIINNFAFVLLNDEEEAESAVLKNHLVLFKENNSCFYNSSGDPNYIALMSRVTGRNYSLLSVQWADSQPKQWADSQPINLDSIGTFHTYNPVKFPDDITLNPDTYRRAQKTTTRSTLFCGQFHERLGARELLSLFHHGAGINIDSISSLNICRKNPRKPHCFVEFSDANEAEKALQLDHAVVLTWNPKGFRILNEKACDREKLLQTVASSSRAALKGANSTSSSNCVFPLLFSIAPKEGRIRR